MKWFVLTLLWYVPCCCVLCVVSGRSVNSVSFLIYYEMGIVVGYEKYEHGLRVRNKINFSTLSVVGRAL